MSSQSDPFSVLIVVIVLLALYFLPMVIALMRGHHNAGAIVVVNLFLGWTFIGWVVCLAWAFTQVHHEPVQTTLPIR